VSFLSRIATALASNCAFARRDTQADLVENRVATCHHGDVVEFKSDAASVHGWPRPAAGSITCAIGPSKRQSTTKWVAPRARRTTTIAGKQADSSMHSKSAGMRI
jgi:hypothetical protein